MLSQRFASELATDTQRWVDLVLARVRAEQPDLLAGEESWALGVASTRALLSQFADVLAHHELDGSGSRDERGERHAPPASIAFARHLARRGVRLASVLRSYRLGNELLLERFASSSGPDLDAATVNRVGLLMLRFADDVTREVADAFDQEREAVLRGAIVRRERLVARLLDGAAVPTAEVERTLGRRMSGSHLALVGWHAAGLEADHIAAAMRPLIDVCCTDTPLVLFGAAGEVHAWGAPRGRFPLAVPPETAARLEAQGIQVALGSPGSGVAGFVATRRQADVARAVAVLRPTVPVTHYRDVALLALLLRDHAAAQAFAAEELGALAGRERNRAVLRETLRVHLESHLDTTRTARALQVHRNTVARRLRRAEQLIGHPLERRASELAAALAIVALPETPTRDAVGA